MVDGDGHLLSFTVFRMGAYSSLGAYSSKYDMSGNSLFQKSKEDTAQLDISTVVCSDIMAFVAIC